MIPIYRWRISKDGGHPFVVHPVYKDDLSLNYEKESQQRFFRAKLSSKIDFVADDANRIIEAPFETKFTLILDMSRDMGLTFEPYYISQFHMTDCTINYDDRKVSVQPEAQDRYNNVLAGLDKEYNLIELAPAIQPIRLTKRPMFQLYSAGESICTCLCGGQAFEVDMADTSEERVQECGFASVDAGWEFNFQNPPVAGFGQPFIGFFHGVGSEFWATDTTYYLTYFEWSEPIVGSRYIQNHNGIRVVQTSTGTTLWEFDQYKVTLWENDFYEIPAELTFSGNPQLTAYRATYGMYGRMVMDRNDVQGWNVSELRTDDVVSNNRNYHYSTPFTDFTATQSSRTSQSPTKWGRNDAGLYFLPPDDVHEWYPVGRSQWVNTSVWVQYSANMANIELQGRKEFTLKDAFPIWSVIKVLLAKVAPDVTHEGTSEYSDWLYGNARGIALFGGDIRLFMSPKSNIIVGEYQEPAMKAPVTLGEVLKMLRNMYGCYWFIDEQNRLRIEHIEWFKNGGSYDGEPVVGINLTKIFNVRNSKDWAYCTNEIKFKKEDMAARYEYDWMDDSTELFNGAIDINSTFVKEDKVEEVTISGYTSDVDYMLMAADMCSKDGFALLGARLVSGVYAVPIVNLGFGNTGKSVQNYYLSMAFLLDNYLTYDMPAWSIEINDVQATANGIQRNRQQQLKFPAGLEDIDFNKLIRTHIGDGEIDRLEMSLSSRMAKVQLNYNTYDRE